MKKLLVLSVVLGLVCVSASAGIVNVADVMGFSAFQDDISGLTWLDIDEFWGMDLPTVQAAIPTGFHLATFSELEALMNSMGGVVGTFAADCAIAGGNCDGLTGAKREGGIGIMWGMYDDGSGPTNQDWAWKWSDGTIGAATTVAGWNVRTSASPATSTGGDLGAWVVADSVTGAPEPSTLVLLATGLGGIGLLRRRL